MKSKMSLNVIAISVFFLTATLSIQSLQAQTQKPTQFYEYYKKAIESKTVIINSDPELLQEALKSGWFDKVEIGLKNAKNFKGGNNDDYSRDIRSGETCETSVPFCTDAGISYPAGTNTVAQEGPDYGCLGAVPNPAWFYMKVEIAGDMEITASSSPPEDIDFILWGPFPDINACDNLTSDNIVDCSFSPSPIEEINIPTAQLAEYYILLITNYSNNSADITLVQTGGTGTTDCSILTPMEPTVNTTTISSITSTSASGGGEVTYDGGLLVTARGVCWNTTGSPTTADTKTSDGDGAGIYTSFIDGLIELTTYYVRAYATNNIGTSYGEELSFTTPEICFNPASGGTISISQTNCGSFNPDEIISLSVPSGETGTLEYKWQKSVTNSTAGFSDISNSNTVSYDPPNISVTTWYKRLARVDCKNNWNEAVETNVVDMTVIQPPTANAGVDATICEDATHTLSGVATNYGLVFWTTSGDGSFDDANLLNATYSPGTVDLSSGTVSLTLTSYAVVPCDIDATDNMVINILDLPSANAGADASICEDATYMLSGIATNNQSVLWTTSGDGSFDDEYILNATYTPGTNDISQESVNLFLFAYSNSPCSGYESDVMILTIASNATAGAGDDAGICFDESYELDGSAEDYESILWTTVGDGSFDNTGLLNATYTPGSNDISNGNIEITLTASSNSTCDGEDVTDSMILSVNYGPDQPTIPEGSIVIDLDLIISSEYSTNLEENVLNYNWNIEPMEVGNIEWEDNIATVYWNTDFVDLIAYVNVMAINSCGASTSEDLIISVSPVGINKYIENDLCINISPNPSDGNFKVSIENATEDIKLLIVNSSGQLILEKKLITNTTKYVEVINISTELAGTYHLKFITEKSVITKKVIINKSF